MRKRPPSRLALSRIQRESSLLSAPKFTLSRVATLTFVQIKTARVSERPLAHPILRTVPIDRYPHLSAAGSLSIPAKERVHADMGLADASPSFVDSATTIAQPCVVGKRIESQPTRILGPPLPTLPSRLPRCAERVLGWQPLQWARKKKIKVP